MKKLIGEILISSGRLTEDTLKAGLDAQEAHGGKIGMNLVKLGYLSYEDLLTGLKEQLGIDIYDFMDAETEPVIVDGISPKFMKQAKFIPVALSGGTLSIAMSDPLDSYTIEAVRLATSFGVSPLLAKEEDILDAVERLYGGGSTHMERIVGDIVGGDTTGEQLEDDIDHLKDMASEGPVIKLVNLVITRALEQRASDIHFEPFENELKVRFRIDGVLHDAEAPPKKLQAAVISRIKIMAKLNIAERRLPQDGRIKLRVLGKEIDFRVSTIPTYYGESVVLRILDRQSVILDLKKLGFPEDYLTDFGAMIKKPHGMILVTGPTGSGKTTTLYASLSTLNDEEKKIITIEDPIEYQINGVNQIQVKPSIGLTFANGLRSIVRQDPDIIMVGEIRDAETAGIAIQSALTGHLVFSTLHTNDSAGAISRLLDMGMEDYLLSSSLLAVLAQRLVRVICVNCKEAFTPPNELMAELENHVEFNGEERFLRGHGCTSCSNTGYRGRIGIYELLNMSDGIKKLIMQKADAAALKEFAVSEGLRTMWDDGWLKIRAGLTTIEEVMRVTRR